MRKKIDLVKFREAKPYSEKLKMLDEVFGDAIGRMHISQIATIIKENPPAELRETPQYNKWLLDRYLSNNPYCNSEKIEEEYFRKIKGSAPKGNPRAKSFTEKEKAKIETALSIGERCPPGTNKSCWYRFQGYRSIEESTDAIIRQTEWAEFSKNVFSYARGIADAEYLTLLEKELAISATGKKKPKRETLSAPVIALFCSLVNEIKQPQKEQNETAENYCLRVCTKYNLSYTDRVRQNFGIGGVKRISSNSTRKNKTKIVELIFPKIDQAIRKKIEKVLSKEQISNQNLYA